MIKNKNGSCKDLSVWGTKKCNSIAKLIILFNYIKKLATFSLENVLSSMSHPASMKRKWIVKPNENKIS